MQDPGYNQLGTREKKVFETFIFRIINERLVRVGRNGDHFRGYLNDGRTTATSVCQEGSKPANTGCKKKNSNVCRSFPAYFYFNMRFAFVYLILTYVYVLEQLSQSLVLCGFLYGP